MLDENNALEIRDEEKLIDAVDKMSTVITKNYLSELSEYNIVEIDNDLDSADISQYMRLYRLNKFVYQKDESIIDKMSTALNAAYISGATVTVIIDSNGDETEYYIGVVDKQRDDGSMVGETFYGALNGNFQGSELVNIEAEEMTKLIERMTNTPEKGVVSSISAIPSLRRKEKDETKTFTQGVENMVDALAGKNYTIVMIADPVRQTEIDRMELGYEMLYSQLAPYAKSSYSISESETSGTTHTDSSSITDSINQSVSYSNSTTVSSSWSTSEGDNIQKNTAKALVGTLGTVGAAAVGMLIAGPVGLAVGGLVGVTATNALPTKSHNTSKTEGGSSSEQEGHTDSSGSSHSENRGTSDSVSESNQRGQTLQITAENKSVQNMLKKIDEHITRLKACRVYGAFNCAAYVISGSTETNGIVAANYNALIRGESSSMQSSHINTWNESGNDIEMLKKYISKFTHPIFVKPNDKEVSMPLDAGSIITGQELAVQTGMPKKSINGVSVVESASFGRNVYRLAKYNAERVIDIGNIYYMGKEADTRVELDLDSLASHVFVTGSTGSGKSNTVYELLNKASEHNVKFLVIEPAKGEYKDIFGGREDVSVFGTNPALSEMLRINPFSFPKEVHILEHLDRLIEIFNVCWPMYAAMPAVLKKAVERAYESCGWNLVTSENSIRGSLFPTFDDVCKSIYSVIEESAYSEDNKSDYIGSLATRIESLTTGFYRMIFSNDELPDEKLFGSNVIVDLSRIGSTETKALIMGILVMKLQEYNMSLSGAHNSELKHITVLEEAHNLLRRTSTEQTTEGSNLLGKSVEMLANAIAEMRTYGEGFIIADQSPGLMDMSVIRNTNTKIVLRLPDYGDRQLVGKSMGLNESQVNELSRLPKGVAAILQNDWLETILCKIDHFEDEQLYKFSKNGNRTVWYEKIIVDTLTEKVLGRDLQYEPNELLGYIDKMTLSAVSKRQAYRALQMPSPSADDIKTVIYDIVCTKNMEREANDAASIEEWTDIFRYDENSIVSDLPDEAQKIVLKCIVREDVERFNKPSEYIDKLDKFINEGVK